MQTLKYLQGQGTKIIATSSPDFGELSLLFVNLSCINDGNDLDNIIESASINIELEVQIDQPEILLCDFRGAMFTTDPACWALVTVNVKGQRMVVHSTELNGNFTRRLEIALEESGTIWLSLLLLCQRHAGDQTTNASIYCDSLDLSFAHKGD